MITSHRTGVQVTPNASLLPGSGVIQTLINGLAGFALMACALGLVIGAGMWALGANSQNYQQSYSGRRAVLVSLGAAVVIGGAKTLINFFFNQGSALH